VVPVAPPNQKERKEDQQTPPKTKNVSFRNHFLKSIMWKIFLFSLSLFFYVLGFRKNTLNNKKDDVKIYDDDELRKKIQKLFSFVFFSSFVVLLLKNIFCSS